VRKQGAAYIIEWGKGHSNKGGCPFADKARRNNAEQQVPAGQPVLASHADGSRPSLSEWQTAVQLSREADIGSQEGGGGQAEEGEESSGQEEGCGGQAEEECTQEKKAEAKKKAA